MKKILVTGGRGFIGSWTVRELLRRGLTPVVLDAHQPDDTREVRGAEGRYGDIRDATAVTEAMAHVDGWIHLAGVLGTQETVANPIPAAEVNILGGLNVLRAAQQYGLPGVNIAVGNHWMNNTYSITKSTMERFAAMYRDELGLKVVTVRALNAYGPGQSVAAPYGNSKVRKIIPSFVMKALHGEPIEVYGDGQQVMDMIWVGDVARVLVDALLYADNWNRGYKVPLLDTLSAGTGRDTTVLEIAQMVNDAVGDGTGVIHYLPMRPGEPERSVVLGDPSTLSVLGRGQTLKPLEVGLAETIQYYREQLR